MALRVALCAKNNSRWAKVCNLLNKETETACFLSDREVDSRDWDKTEADISRFIPWLQMART